MKTPGQRQLVSLQERVKVGDISVDEAVQEFKAWQVDHERRASSIRFQQVEPRPKLGFLRPAASLGTRTRQTAFLLKHRLRLSAERLLKAAEKAETELVKLKEAGHKLNTEKG